MELESKFRIVQDGERVFGKGPCILLETVDRLGSLNKAVSELGMSYSKAWSIIHKAETMFGYPLLETQTGGIDGGGSYLTPEAKTLIKAYNKFCEEAQKDAEKLYKKYFQNT